MKPDRSRLGRLLLWFLAAAVLVAAVAWIPIMRGPSLAEWAGAYYRGDGKPHDQGNGKPHLRIPSTPEARKKAFFKRHPELLPAWREVPLERNGTIQLQEFVLSHAASGLELPPELAEMLRGNVAWDQNAARDFCETHRAQLDELRRIALMTERSSKGRPWGRYMDIRSYTRASDALAFSMKYRLHSEEMAGASLDFSALFGLAAHMDRHETANTLEASVAILIRRSAQNAMLTSLETASTHTDWSSWIRVLEGEPAFTDQLASAYRGELLSMYGFLWQDAMNPGAKNSIPDVAQLEDALATNLLELSNACASAERLQDIDLTRLEQRRKEQSANLSPEARDLIHTAFIGSGTATKGPIRAEAQQDRTLAALQLLQAERNGGAIQDPADPRLGSLTVDSSNEKPFQFDPVKRLLTPAAGSAIADEKPLHLPGR